MGRAIESFAPTHRKRPTGEDRVALHWEAQVHVPEGSLRNMFEAADRVTKVASDTIATSEMTDKLCQEAMTVLETTPTETSAPSVIKSSYSADSTLRLRMFEKDSLEKGALEGLADKHFGIGRKWVAARTDPFFKEALKKRDAKLQQAYLRKNPISSAAEFQAQRELDKKRTDMVANKLVFTRFRNAITEDLDVTAETPMHFADRHLDHASTAYNTIHDRLFPDDVSPLRNEAAMPIINPAKIIETITSPKTGEELRKQTIDRLLLAKISGEIEAKGKVEQGSIKLAQVQAVLDTYLFDDPVGSTTTMKTRVLFDDKTNTPLFVEGVDTPKLNKEEGTHIKTITLPMRSLRESAVKVFTNPDRKKMPSAIEKALKKAILRKQETGDDTIRPAKDVTDMNRAIVVPLEGREFTKGLTNNIADILVEHQDELTGLDDYGNPTLFAGGIVKDIRPDSDPNGTPDQGKPVYERVQVEFTDLPNPLEIIVQSARDFYESQYQVGLYDKKRKKYSGNSHSLYNIARSRMVAPTLLNGSYNEKKARKTYHRTAAQLKSIARDTIK
jgi:hypothetical protein